jgi:hypothetical protein
VNGRSRTARSPRRDAGATADRSDRPHSRRNVKPRPVRGRSAADLENRSRPAYTQAVGVAADEHSGVESDCIPDAIVAGVAQLVERQLPKLNVGSSSLLARSGRNDPGRQPVRPWNTSTCSRSNRRPCWGSATCSCGWRCPAGLATCSTQSTRDCRTSSSAVAATWLRSSVAASFGPGWRFALRRVSEPTLPGADSLSLVTRRGCTTKPSRSRRSRASQGRGSRFAGVRHSCNPCRDDAHRERLRARDRDRGLQWGTSSVSMALPTLVCTGSLRPLNSRKADLLFHLRAPDRPIPVLADAILPVITRP